MPTPESLRKLRHHLFVGAMVAPTVLVGHAAKGDEPRAGEGVVNLKSGGTLPGQFRTYSQDTTRATAVVVDEGLKVLLPAVHLARIQGDDPRLVEYRRRAAEVEESAEAHWDLSVWCAANNLREQNERHLRRVIELEPNHGSARQALNFQPFDSRWVKIDTLRRERGMMRDNGHWRFAEELIGSQSEEELFSARKDWIGKINGLKVQVKRGGPKGEAARQQLIGIDDPAADEAVVKEFLEVRGKSVNERLEWLSIMARIRTPLCVNAIVNSSMNDPDLDVRDECIELLRERDKYQAITFYLSNLGSNDNDVVKRAGRALSEINDPEIALSLVEALTTKHKVVVGGGNGYNVGNAPGSNPGDSMTFGGNKQQIKTVPVNNPEVLTALLNIIPDDVNYQYDKDRWRRYFANKLAPPPGDLRRDP